MHLNSRLLPPNLNLEMIKEMYALWKGKNTKKVFFTINSDTISTRLFCSAKLWHKLHQNGQNSNLYKWVFSLLTPLPTSIFWLMCKHHCSDHPGTFREYEHLFSPKPTLSTCKEKLCVQTLIPGLYFPPWHPKPNVHVSLLKYWRSGHVLHLAYYGHAMWVEIRGDQKTQQYPSQLAL